MGTHFNSGSGRETRSDEGPGGKFLEDSAASDGKKSVRLGIRYLAELRAHVRATGPNSADRARNIGHLALASGLATVDLARLHEATVVMLASSADFIGTRARSLRRTGYFLTQALIPMEAARRATLRANRVLLQRNETLRLHTAALAKVNRRLAREVRRREAGQTAIRLAKERYRTLFAESQLMQRKLHQLTRQIISAQEEERKEISRELHDEVVQTLVGINVQLSALNQGASVASNFLQRKIVRTQRLVEKSVKAVHRFARELRPAVLDDLGLIPALHAYSKNLAARKKIKIQLTAFAGVEDLGSRERTALFRVAQEALTNVVRHAQATLAKLTIIEIPGGIRMEIADDGRSFNPGPASRSRNSKRLGLIGMQERMAMIGGTLAIESVKGIGTSVRAEIPFRGRKPKP
jgi:signal transduction histidine kinase